MRPRSPDSTSGRSPDSPADEARRLGGKVRGDTWLAEAQAQSGLPHRGRVHASAARRRRSSSRRRRLLGRPSPRMGMMSGRAFGTTGALWST
jgi:hypothetical protein